MEDFSLGGCEIEPPFRGAGGQKAGPGGLNSGGKGGEFMGTEKGKGVSSWDQRGAVSG